MRPSAERCACAAGDRNNLLRGFELRVCGAPPRYGPQHFRQKYPNSTVDATTVWVSKVDAHDQVRYVRRWTNAGKDELNILFEVPYQELAKKPTSFEEEHYARNPLCVPILKRLTNIYGKPAKTRSWVEERLSHRASTWTKGRAEMSLDCYRVDGKGNQLAAEITIRVR